MKTKHTPDEEFVDDIIKHKNIKQLQILNKELQLREAAPELLEALQECMKHMTVHKEQSALAYQNAQKAIKKATE